MRKRNLAARACLALLTAAALLGPRGTVSAEVMSHEIGPRSSLATNNTNIFDWNQTQPGTATADCDPERFEKEYGRKPCAGDMVWVCSRFFGISACTDKDLAVNKEGRPAGNFSRDTCAAYCERQGKRLLSNNEWLVSCTGTPVEPCLNYGGEWPPGYFAKKPDHPCARYGTGSAQCMSDPRLTSLMPATDSACRSEAGVAGCAGTLGQWVSGNIPGTARGRFNGGLFPQRASSVIYTTTAHSHAYSDYSIGCRCAADAAATK